MKKPKSMWDIDPDIILSKTDTLFNCYDNIPLRKWDADMFVEYMKDWSHPESGISKCNYFYECGKQYWDDLYKVNQIRVYLYGVWTVIEDVMRAIIHRKKNKK